MRTRNYTRQFPPQPRVIDNGWGPNYPVGMTNLELVEYAPNGLFAGSTMYDLYRTNGGMGSGMVDSFAYDPITQYGALSSNVAEGGGNSDSSLWFLLMNHQPPFRRYPFTSVENSMSLGSESKYFENSQSQKTPQMSIAEKTGTGWFESLNQESRLLPTTTSSSTTVSGKGPATTTTSPTSGPSGSGGKTVACPPGTVKVGGICIKQTATVSHTPISRPPISIRCAPGFVPVNGVCQPVSAPVAVLPVAPVGAAGMMGGGGGSAAGEESADQQGDTAGRGAVDCKTNYLAVLIGAVLGAGIAYLIAKKYGKNIKKSSIIGALIGALLGLAYAIHQCRPIGIMSKMGIKSKVTAAPASTGQSSYCGACGA